MLILYMIQESDYDYLKRTIGPGSWVYEILQQNLSQKEWDLFEMELKSCGNDKNRKKAIAKSFRYSANSRQKIYNKSSKKSLKND